MASELRLMCVLAHPDDESLVNGGRTQETDLFEGLR
jgi:LmbE family N-acetylglucosaminyl deacetylase